jgi:hypothetical protein
MERLNFFTLYTLLCIVVILCNKIYRYFFKPKIDKGKLIDMLKVNYGQLEFSMGSLVASFIMIVIVVFVFYTMPISVWIKKPEKYIE